MVRINPSRKICNPAPSDSEGERRGWRESIFLIVLNSLPNFWQHERLVLAPQRPIRHNPQPSKQAGSCAGKVGKLERG